jgi:hypothetical protein
VVVTLPPNPIASLVSLLRIVAKPKGTQRVQGKLYLFGCPKTQELPYSLIWQPIAGITKYKKI